MRNFVAGLVVAGLMLSAVAPVAAQQQGAPKHAKKNTVQQATETYACPMHPEVTGDEGRQVHEVRHGAREEVREASQDEERGDEARRKEQVRRL